MCKFLVATALIFFFVSNGYSQTLNYKPNCKIYNAQGERMSAAELNKLFSVNTIVYDSYREGRDKKNIGGVLMFGGLGLMITDVAIAGSSGVKYPSALTIIGGVAFVISIPVKIGYSKKIKQAVDDFNRIYPDGNTATLQDKKIEFIADSDGLGFRFTLN